MFESIFILIIALVLISAVIWAFDKYVTILQPFKGLIMFLLIVGAAFFVWHQITTMSFFHGAFK